MPWTHCMPVRVGLWSMWGHGSDGFKVTVGRVKFIPSNDTSSCSVPHSFENVPMIVGSLSMSVAVGEDWETAYKAYP